MEEFRQSIDDIINESVLDSWTDNVTYKVLLITSANNSMCQRVNLELQAQGHTVETQIAFDDESMIESVELFQPDIIICPMLTKKIPESIFNDENGPPCIIVHPGITGDRGPSSIDWALRNDLPEWGVTLLQADEEMDAGPIWATKNAPTVRTRADTKPVSKSSLYKVEVIESAVECLKEVMRKFHAGEKGTPLDYSDPTVKGTLMPAMKYVDRTFDWSLSREEILRIMLSSDTAPGALAEVDGHKVFVYGPWTESEVTSDAAPGTVIGERQGAVLIQTGTQPLWVSHLKRRKLPPYEPKAFKLPSTSVLGPLGALDNVPSLPPPAYELPANTMFPQTFQEVWTRTEGGVCFVHFEIYNGAMNTMQCKDLERCLLEVSERPDVKVVVLAGGYDYFSNGINLNTIEAAEDPAEESWLNINAINDVIKATFSMRDKVTISAVRANAGAGGVMMALGADEVWSHDGVVMNPHYKTMGLFGSEYWTHFLKERAGNFEVALNVAVTTEPILANSPLAQAANMVDRVIPTADREEFMDILCMEAAKLAADEDKCNSILSKKQEKLDDPENMRQVRNARELELRVMRNNFKSAEYNDARRNFVLKTPCTKETCTIKLTTTPKVSPAKKPSVTTKARGRHTIMSCIRPAFASFC